MSSSPEAPPHVPVYCSYCGAAWKAPAERCWLCHQKPLVNDAGVIMAEAVSRIHPSSPAAVPHKPFQFGISSLLLIMTLVCIIGSVTTMAPGLGIAMMVLGVPALVHTCVVASRRGASGKPMSSGAKALSFTLGLVTALAVTAVAGVAAFVTFFAVCAVGGNQSAEAAAWMAVAAAIGVIVIFLVFYVQYQRRKRRR